MIHARETLEDLFTQRVIELDDAPLIWEQPDPPDRQLDFHDRVRGMMLGLAVGDALGRPTEGHKPARRAKLHGEVRDYVIKRHTLEAVGTPSDDTQMAFWTLEQLLEDGRFVPEHLAAKFVEREIFGMGQSVGKFRRQYKKLGQWTRCGARSAGNGALMRIAPMIIPWLFGHRDARAQLILSAMMTHNDRSSTAACAALGVMLERLIVMDAPPEPSWWLDTYVDVASQLEGGSTYSPRGAPFRASYKGSCWGYVRDAVEHAQHHNLQTVDACNQTYSGAYLLETLPCVILLLTRYADDPEEAIIRAINDTKDNDTAGAIVGAAVGALHGARALPARWIDGLTGRTSHDDDGRVFDLLDELCAKWDARTLS